MLPVVAAGGDTTQMLTCPTLGPQRGHGGGGGGVPEMPSKAKDGI